MEKRASRGLPDSAWNTGRTEGMEAAAAPPNAGPAGLLSLAIVLFTDEEPGTQGDRSSGVTRVLYL